MNTEVIIHPKLQHVGIMTANLDAMLDWYRKVLGMTVNYRITVPADSHHGAPFSAVAFASNDEMHHRISFFEVPGLALDPDRGRHARVQHIAFEYATLDDLLGTHVRLKNLGIRPEWAADQSFQTAMYYLDPDQNVLEFNVDNYEDIWTATEQLKNLPTCGPTTHRRA
jgi:catechol 2,3-dioxygenase-like lactoylglutathione lyase family enzyme